MARSVLVLASASPRRAELLTAAGIPFHVRVADVDERLEADEDPERYVRRVATDKARTVAAAVPGQAVLAADTVVLVEGQVLGKPRDAEDARRMLRLLSGRTHQVLTAVTLLTAHGRQGALPGFDTEVAVTSVEFAPLDASEIDWYVATGEPADKAGAYAIQGLASRFVTRIDGSYSNVVGLPVALVYRLCTRAGLLLS
ncbi:MAG TPA: Maf family protein [Gemmatimonadales bacterium]|nr:Maf family protein [Gemmatimonadales bacterium]